MRRSHCQREGRLWQLPACTLRIWGSGRSRPPLRGLSHPPSPANGGLTPAPSCSSGPPHGCSPRRGPAGRAGLSGPGGRRPGIPPLLLCTAGPERQRRAQPSTVPDPGGIRGSCWLSLSLSQLTTCSHVRHGHLLPPQLQSHSPLQKGRTTLSVRGSAGLQPHLQLAP